MKIILGLFLCVLLSIVGFGQTKQSGANTDNQENAAPKKITALQNAKNALFYCYNNHYNQKAEKYNPDDKVFKDCEDKATSDLMIAFQNAYKQTSEISDTATRELLWQYQKQLIGQAFGVPDKSDEKINDQLNLQRIIVLQNQRIIELLEKLLIKK